MKAERVFIFESSPRFMKTHIIPLCVGLAFIASCSKQKAGDASSATSAPAPEQGVKVAYGIQVEGKPGYVRSPYAPDDGYIDVRGFPKNTEVKDPYTGRIFLVPESASSPAAYPGATPQ